MCVVHHDDSMDQVSWSSMSAQQHRIEERVDAEDLARQVRAQDDRIAQLRQELQEQVRGSSFLVIISEEDRH